MSGSSEKPFYPVLEGIRGIAAVVVVARHSSPFMTNLFFHSYLAVDLFFMLSGFVLASSYDERLEQRRLSAFDFMKLRLIRLYPFFVLASIIAGTAAVLTVTYFGNHLTSPVAWLKGAPLALITAAFSFSLLMLPSVFSHELLYPLNGPAWTLFYELIVNFIYALARPRFSFRTMGCVSLVCGLAIAVCVFVRHHLNIGFIWSDVPIGLARTLYAFFAGVVLFAVHRRYGACLVRRESSFLGVLLLLFVWGFLVVPSLAFFDPFYDVIALFVLFPFVVLGATLIVPKEGCGRVFAALGAASYGLYVLHVPVWELTSIGCYEVFDHRLGSLAGIVVFPCLFLSVLLLVY